MNYSIRVKFSSIFPTWQDFSFSLLNQTIIYTYLKIRTFDDTINFYIVQRNKFYR